MTLFWSPASVSRRDERRPHEFACCIVRRHPTLEDAAARAGDRNRVAAVARLARIARQRAVCAVPRDKIGELLHQVQPNSIIAGTASASMSPFRDTADSVAGSREARRT